MLSHSNDDSVTSDSDATLLSETDSHNDDDSVASDKKSATWFSDSEITYSENKIQAACFVSHIIQHNVSCTATKDLRQLLPILCPDSGNFQNMTR